MREGKYQESPVKRGGRLLEVVNGGECYVADLWVGDIGADSWGRYGLDPSSAMSLPRSNIPSNGVSFCHSSIGSFSVVRDVLQDSGGFF